MQTTEHLNLNLPEATDPYDIGNENENMEILDSAIYNHGIILGTTSAAGHVKTINDLTKTSLTNGEALSARMGNALGQMMAPIVTGPNYPSGITKKGDQFVYNGRLCVVTANTVSTSTAINIGASGNANYASPITSQISDCNTKISELTELVAVNFTINDTRITVNTAAAYLTNPKSQILNLAFEVVAITSTTAPIIYIPGQVRRNQALACVDTTDGSSPAVAPCYANNNNSSTIAIIVPIVNGHKYLITGDLQIYPAN